MKGTTRCVAIATASLCALLLAGCAAARDPTTGDVVIGWSLAKLPETSNQLLATGLAAATGIPGVGSLALGALGVLGTAFGAKKVAEKRAEDRGWREAQATYSPPPGTILVPSAGLSHTQLNPPPAVPAGKEPQQ